VLESLRGGASRGRDRDAEHEGRRRPYAVTPGAHATTKLRYVPARFPLYCDPGDKPERGRRETTWRAATARAPHPRPDAARADCNAPDRAVAGDNAGLAVHLRAHHIGHAEPPIPIDQRTVRHGRISQW
jgi:hypothetical protein